MLKKTQIIELFKNIEKTKVPFISIVLFILLGMSLFLGIDWANTGFTETIERDLNLGKMQDVEIIYPYGFSEDLIEDIQALEDVETAEGIYNTEVFFRKNGLKYQANVVMLTDSVNLPTHITGSLPVSDSEIAVEESWALTHGISVGDTILIEDSGNAVKTLINDTFTVTALVTSSQFLNKHSGCFGVSQTTGISHDCVFFVSEDAFNKPAFMGYTTIAVRSKSLRQYQCFTDQYRSENRKFIKRLKLLTDDYVDLKNADLPQGYKACKCQLFGRDLNAGLAAAKNPGQIMSTVKYSLSIMFVIVGLFVCYSAVSRIVYEQTKLIGTKKALGLSRKQIMLAYLLYAAIAVIIGSIPGALLARFLIEPIIIQSLAENFNLIKLVNHFSLRDALLFFLFDLFTTGLFAYLACRTVLKKTTLQLLNEDTIISGKQHWFEKSAFWKKIPLLTKTIINNILNDKKRVFATLTGIVGSSSLLVCAMIMLANVYYTRDYHYNNITTYDTTVYADANTPGAIDDIDAYFKNKGIKCARTYNSNIFLKIKDGYAGAMFTVSDDPRFYSLFHIYTDKEEHSMPGDVWICKSYANYNNLKEGDKIEIIDTEGINRTLSIGGVFEYYQPNDIVLMSAESYEDVFERDFIPNSLIFNSNGTDIRKLTYDIDKIDGFISIYKDREAGISIFDAIIGVILILVGTFTAISVVMGAVIILNLLIMFVSEKKRELIIMMINGYSKRSVKKYIYCDTILLSVIGSIIGTVIGVLIGFLTLRMFSSECVILMHRLSIPMCVLCMAVTGLLTATAVMIALRKVDGFKLQDINEM